MMNGRFSVSYHHLVVESDVPKISREWRTRIRRAIEDKLMTQPEIFGKPLRRSLAGYRKLRVGDYRVIFQIDKLEVKVFVIGHRRDVYRISEKRK